MSEIGSLLGKDLARYETEGGAKQAEGRPERAKRLKRIERSQVLLRAIDVEKLVEEDHVVRGIWAMVKRLDMRRLEEGIKAVEGGAGQSSFDPRMLMSLWIYGYSQGVSSARELSRMCEWEPGCQWLTGMEGVNYHGLADFRVQHKEVLDEIFVQVLGLLSAEGLVELKRVMRAQERARLEKKARLEHALEELEQLQKARSASKRGQTRVSETDPEARVMKQSDGGFAASYNVQISTEASHGIIVGVDVTQAGNDYDQLEAGIDRVKANTGQEPGQAVVDGGYIKNANIEAMAQRGIDLIGPVPENNPGASFRQRGIEPAFYPDKFRYDPMTDRFRCPAGRWLKRIQTRQCAGRIEYSYRALARDCATCRFRDQCCPKSSPRRVVRREDSEAVQAFRAKMATEEAKQIYRTRAQIAENAWIKEKLGLRRFRLRGRQKVRTEAVWACLTYNIQQWIRITWRPHLQVVA